MQFNSEDSSPPSSLRFIYLVETGLLSSKSSQPPSDSGNRSLDWTSSPSYHAHYPQSPCSESSSHQCGRGAHQDSSNGLPTGRRKSLRKSLAKALVSPVRVAKDKMSIGSPRRMGESLKQALGNNPLFSRRETWQEELNLPRNTTEEQAIAILLSRELDQLDF
jgi:hypothetical protein